MGLLSMIFGKPKKKPTAKRKRRGRSKVKHGSVQWDIMWAEKGLKQARKVGDKPGAKLFEKGLKDLRKMNY